MHIEVNNEMGCAKLVAEVVFQSLNPKQENEKNKECTNKDIRRSRKINRGFARNSKLLVHFCDVYNIDIGKVRKKIIEINK